MRRTCPVHCTGGQLRPGNACAIKLYLCFVGATLNDEAATGSRLCLLHFVQQSHGLAWFRQK